MRRRRRSIRFTPVALALLAATLVVGIAHCRWAERLLIAGTVATDEWGSEIGSHKILSTSECSGELSSDRLKLHVSADAEPGWYVWVGLVLENVGPFDASITHDISVENQTLWDNYFTHERYFYGPYRTAIPREVWARVKPEPPPEDYVLPPPPGGEITPPNFPADHKLVIWLKITLSEDCPEDAFETFRGDIAFIVTSETGEDVIRVSFMLSMESKS